MEDYADSSGLVNGETIEDRTQKIIQHPLLAFRMIYRFIHDIELIKNLTSKLSKDNEYFWSVLQMNEKELISWPKLEHLKEGMDGLLRLSFIYDLSVPDVRKI